MKSANRLRPVAGASGRAAVAEEGDGPPDIQTQAITRKVIEKLGQKGMALADAISLSDMTSDVGYDETAPEEIVRDPTVAPTDWPDPEDRQAHLRRTGARHIRGFKRVWQIDTLHASSPRELTWRHVRAATRLLDTYQRSLGAMSGRDMDRQVVDNGRADMGPEDNRIVAAREYEEAMEAMGLEGALIVFHVAIMNRSLRDMETEWGMLRHKLHGRLCASLSRLLDHYEPPSRSTPVASQMPVPVPDGDLPAERFGRWRELTP